MRHFIRPFAVLFAVAACSFAGAARADLVLPRVSPSATVKQTVGTTDFTLVYSRPGVKNRAIWGTLVPYDSLWRTGANEATTLTSTDPFQFGGQAVPAGTYELFTIPGRNQWTVILNRENGGWGTNTYKRENDVVRVTATPSAAEPSEWLWLGFEDLGASSANLVLRWEKLRVAVPISVDVNGKVLAAARDAVAAMKPDDWRTCYQAASFCLSANVAMDEGRAWLDRSLKIQRNFSNVGLDARWLAQEGRKADAIRTAEQALEIAKTAKDKPETGPLEQSLAGWKAGR
ncbi:MAG TPA: DUF2911 domain-containing protein [Candidatus Acidoferrales bacterium]|nr:DUF2911 domain-containing protein [Candidatus Acidoferrales bacterium]